MTVDEDLDETRRIPLVLLFVGGVLLALAGLLAFVATDTGTNLMGLALAVLSYGTLLFHRQQALFAVDDPRYERVNAINIAMTLLLLGSFIAIAANVYPLALEAAER